MSLQVNGEDGKRRALTQLSQLRASPGWKIVKDRIAELVAEEERGIMKTGGNEVKYSEQDLRKERRRMLLDIVSYPETLIGELTSSNEAEQEEFDPYP